MHACALWREPFRPKAKINSSSRRRKTLQAYDKAIVSLAAVVKIDAGGRGSREHKTRCVGAIIDPCGLAVTSLTNLNPQSLLKLRFSHLGGSQTLDFDCQVQEVKYRLTDGTEVPARIVLKDEDLDLAFLAPLKPLNAQRRRKSRRFRWTAQPATWMCSIRRSLWTGRAKA